jgi:hypothetical protein|tara:strand:+ start:86 stop:340 length:255 start_codon:yes stop_codon:yes gene_type:complete
VAEHAFDGVATFAEHFREAAFPAPVGLGRDIRNRALALDQIANGVAIIGFVSMNEAIWRKARKQRHGSPAIDDVAAREKEPDRP